MTTETQPLLAQPLVDSTAPIALRTAEPVLVLLAEHFNAALRHGEALRAIERPAAAHAFSGMRVGGLIKRNRAEEAVAAEVHAMELAIVLRLRRARAVIGSARKTLPSRAALLRLAQTVGDAVADIDPVAPTGAAASFFVSRGLATEVAERTLIGEDFLVCGKVPLSALMDGIAAALDLIDTIDAID